MVSQPHDQVNVSAMAAGEFLDALRRAHLAMNAKREDTELEALWDLAAASCGILDLWLEDAGRPVMAECPSRLGAFTEWSSAVGAHYRCDACSAYVWAYYADQHVAQAGLLTIPRHQKHTA